MKCPYCNEEMEYGFIQGRDGVFWSEKERPVAAINLGGGKKVRLDDGEMNGIFGGYSAKAWLCGKCNIILIEYYGQAE